MVKKHNVRLVLDIGILDRLLTSVTSGRFKFVYFKVSQVQVSKIFECVYHSYIFCKLVNIILFCYVYVPLYKIALSRYPRVMNTMDSVMSYRLKKKVTFGKTTKIIPQ